MKNENLEANDNSKSCTETLNCQEIAEAQTIEMKLLKIQLQKVEMMFNMLETKLETFRAKNQKSSYQLVKLLLEIKNQA